MFSVPDVLSVFMELLLPRAKCLLLLLLLLLHVLDFYERILYLTK